MILFYLHVKDKMSNYCKANRCRYATSHVTAGHQCGVCHQYGHGQVECKKPEVLRGYMNDVLPTHLQCQVIGCKHSEVHTTDSHIATRSSELVYDPSLSKWRVRNGEDQTVKCPLCRVENKYFDVNSLKVFGITQKCIICAGNDIDVVLPACKHACMCKTCLEKLNTEREEPTDARPDFDEYSHVLRNASMRLGDRNMVWVVEYVGQRCMWYFKRVDDAITAFFLHGDNHGHVTDNIPRLQAFLTGCSRLN